ncbi:hypothetical protein [Catellatospora vulcania]|uniref:hypothetical protein n=1 Tax=Catellatospora vulcania TaxID=1460450 RepID=UPI0012D3DACA|nr:hypothetical protein [Catellatospora vulcania]
MTQQLFDEVIGEVPAPAVDVDGIVRRERRGAAARRFGVVSTGGLALLAVGALVLGLGLGASPTPIAVPATSDVPGAPVAAGGFRLMYGTPEEAAETAERLSQELDRAVLAAAPDRQWLSFPTAPGDPQQPDGQPMQVKFVDKPLMEGGELEVFAGRSGIAAGGRKGSLSLHIVPVVAGGLREPLPTQDVPQPGFAYVRHAVSVPLADGRVLVLACYNRSHTRKLAPAFQAETPLSVAQLQAIADAVAAKVLA